MLQFYRTYPVVTALNPQLSWTHYTALIEVADAAARQFYEAQAVRNTWSVRALRQQIKEGFYARSLAAPGGAAVAPRALPPRRPLDTFRALYDIALPGLPADFSEAQSGGGAAGRLRALPGRTRAGVLPARHAAAAGDRWPVSRGRPGTVLPGHPVHRAG